MGRHPGLQREALEERLTEAVDGHDRQARGQVEDLGEQRARALPLTRARRSPSRAASSSSSWGSGAVASRPRSSCTRPTISAAAALVKVRHNSWRGSQPASSDAARGRRAPGSCAVPADAVTQTEQDGSAARRWAAVGGCRRPGLVGLTTSIRRAAPDGRSRPATRPRAWGAADRRSRAGRSARSGAQDPGAPAPQLGGLELAAGLSSPPSRPPQLPEQELGHRRRPDLGERPGLDHRGLERQLRRQAAQHLGAVGKGPGLVVDHRDAAVAGVPGDRRALSAGRAGRRGQLEDALDFRPDLERARAPARSCSITQRDPLEARPPQRHDLGRWLKSSNSWRPRSSRRRSASTGSSAGRRGRSAPARWITVPRSSGPGSASRGSSALRPRTRGVEIVRVRHPQPDVADGQLLVGRAGGVGAGRGSGRAGGHHRARAPRRPSHPARVLDARALEQRAGAPASDRARWGCPARPSRRARAPRRARTPPGRNRGPRARSGARPRRDRASPACCR